MLKESVARICFAARVTADDVGELRRAFYGEASISADEAATLFRINDACAVQEANWPVFFAEALTDYIVHQAEPHGYVSEDNAQWLVQQIGLDGQIKHDSEMELLIKILESAKQVPDALAAYGLDQVKNAVITGAGPLRSGLQLEAGRVDAVDVEILRRILYAYAGGGHIAVTAAEAEVLFDINDATLDADNDPAWSDLFAKAVANHLMFATRHVKLDRETALRREKWLGDTQSGMLDFVGAMVSSLRKIYAEASPREPQLFETEIINTAEAEWLLQRVNRDSRISPAERAALLFIKQEARDIDAALLPLLDKVA